MGPLGNLLHDLHQAFWLPKHVTALLGNSIQFFLKYKTIEDCCLCCTGCIHLPLFWFWKGRNEIRLKVPCFWEVSEQVCYVGVRWGRALRRYPAACEGQTVWHLLANGCQNSGILLPPASLCEDSGIFTLRNLNF